MKSKLETEDVRRPRFDAFMQLCRKQGLDTHTGSTSEVCVTSFLGGGVVDHGAAREGRWGVGHLTCDSDTVECHVLVSLHQVSCRPLPLRRGNSSLNKMGSKSCPIVSYHHVPITQLSL